MLAVNPTSVHPQETSEPTHNRSSLGIASTPTPCAGVRFRHRHWLATRNRIRAALPQAGVPDRVLDRWDTCGSRAWVFRHKTRPGDYRIRCQRCKHRFCTPCAITRGLRLSRAINERMQGTFGRFVTLTLRSDNVPLTDQVARIFRCFASLRRKPIWHDHVTGGVSVLEVTYSPTRRQWHPHLHIIIQGSYIQQAALSADWHAITGDSYMVDVRAIRSAHNVTRYVTKYVGKALDSEHLQTSGALHEAIQALKHVRMMTTFGNWRGLRLTAPAADADDWEPIASLDTLEAQAAANDQDARRILNALASQERTAFQEFLDLPGAAHPCITTTGPSPSG